MVDGTARQRRGSQAVTATGVRVRRPQQERSRARVDRLLTAADRILGTDGYEALTIARLTEAAGVPVGTYYQFFRDKAAIVEALALRYVHATGALIARQVDAIVEQPAGTRLASAFEAFVELYRANPA